MQLCRPILPRPPKGNVLPMSSRRVFAVLCLTCACSAFGITEGDMYRALGERGIPYDTQAVHRAAAEAILREVDPGGRLLGPDSETRPETVTVEAVEEWQDGIGYLDIGGMHGDGSNAAAHLSQWSTNGPFGIVIDLREAGGNSLQALDRIAGALVVSNTTLYSVVDSAGTTSETHRASGEAGVVAGSLPVMLLIDGQTHDASELLAAVLKGRDGVMLLGSPTRGDFRVRSEIPLPDDGGAFLATGRAIPYGELEYHAVGVEPDIVVDCGAMRVIEAGPAKSHLGEPLTDRAQLDRDRTLRIGHDAALTRAVDILLALKALRVDSQ